MLSMNRTIESPWIVLVEDDESLRGELADALERALPEVEVQRTPDADVALRLVRDSRSRLLITEAQTSSVDGMALATCARRQRPQLPLIFLADTHAMASSARVATLNGSHLIDKPPHLDQFVGLVARVLEPVSGFRGEVSTRGMLELVQLVAMTTPTGALRLSGSEGEGTVWFEGGSVVHAALVCKRADPRASMAGERGLPAFQRMLCWRSGYFSVDEAARAPERTVTSSTIELLLDAACMLDESNAGVGRRGDGESGRAADHFERGLAAVWRKAYADALPEWQRAAALEPTNRLYQHNLMRLQHLINLDREQGLGEVTGEHQEQCGSD